MIDYDVGRWSFAFAFRLSGSVAPRACAWASLCSALSFVLHWILLLGDETTRETMSESVVNGQAFSAFSVVLGFLIVFRAQQGYSRWNEAAGLMLQLGAEWKNAFSCVLAFGNYSPEYADRFEHLQHRMVRLFSLLFSTALCQICLIQDNHFEVINLEGFDEKALAHMSRQGNSCETVLHWIQRGIVEAYYEGSIMIPAPILTRVYQQLGAGITTVSGAMRITDFQVPFILAQFIVVMLIGHLIITALVCALAFDQWILVVTASFVSSFVLQGLNIAAVELEVPFGDDLNDIPLKDMMSHWNTSLINSLHVTSLACPRFDFDRPRDLLLQLQKLNLEKHPLKGARRFSDCSSKIARSDYADYKAALESGAWKSPDDWLQPSVQSERAKEDALQRKNAAGAAGKGMVDRILRTGRPAHQASSAAPPQVWPSVPSGVPEVAAGAVILPVHETDTDAEPTATAAAL